MRMVFPHSTGRLLDELSSDFNSFFDSILNDEPSNEKVGFSPRMDFEELDDSYRFAMDVPGVDPDEIHVDMEDNHVVVHGTRHPTWEESTEGHRRSERLFGTFKRTLRLPKLVDKDGIKADYSHGVLTVTIPKAEKQTRRITVSQSSTT